MIDMPTLEYLFGFNIKQNHTPCLGNDIMSVFRKCGNPIIVMPVSYLAG